MATERSEHQMWAESQISALIELGINPIDAQKSVDWVLDNLPHGEDPATYVFPAHALWQEPASREAIDDAAADWIAKDSVPARFKRILHARLEE